MHRLYKFNEDRKGFGANLKKLMRENNYTIESFMNEVGYDENTIKKWRNGSRIPNLNTLIEMAKIFGITVHELYLPNSIYESEFSDEFKKVLDGRLIVKKTDYELIKELEDYSNYLFQKMLFSYLNLRDMRIMKNIYKYFSISKYAIDRLSITNKTDFEEFYRNIKRYIIEQYGVGLPYKIDNEMSIQILKDFDGYISLDIKEEE